ncbi:hypothetical protein QCA50_017344 [Cerrena zonata]|uniref:Uncharacterized protein n=1 Tax=Cerrena zonata TaxID=2478898 RepID=A0AAW0FQT6_9APHY
MLTTCTPVDHSMQDNVPTSLSSRDTFRFTSLVAQHFGEGLEWVQASTATGPPAALPHNVSSFLAEAFGVDVPCITRAWTAQRELIWECRTQRSSLLDETALRNGRYLPFFLQYGVRHRTGTLNPICKISC